MSRVKVTNKNFKSIDELEKNLDISKIDPRKTLIQIFTGFVSEDVIEKLQNIIKKKNDEALFIGATSAGEIYQGGIYEKTINVSIMEFENTFIEQDSFSAVNDFDLGKQIATSLFGDNTKAVILLMDGLQTNANDVIDGIGSIENSITIAGGLAGDDGAIAKTFVFDRNGVYAKGCVAASLNSDCLHVFTQYQLNWQAIGKTMTVTKADKNRLYEIDGINVSEIYTRYLGEKIGDNLPHSATEFPLLKIEEDGNEVCRTFIHRFDDGSLLTIGNLEVGDKVRLAFGNVDLILENTKKNVKTYRSFQPEGIFIYSCAARKVFLQSEIVAELKPFNAIAPNIGFFTFGEIFHNTHKNTLLNMSLTVLALREREIQENITEIDENGDDLHEKNFMSNKHILGLEALTHLSNTVIAELEEAKKQLQEQANRDFLTKLYNRRYFNEIAQDLLHIAKREGKPLSVVLIDIDKFKTINDTYGHMVGDEVIKTLANTIVETVRVSDIVARFGGEEFALLLPFTDMEGANNIAERIRKNVESQKIVVDNGDIIQFTISLGIASILPADNNIEEPLHRADKALYVAKENGRNMVVAD